MASGTINVSPQELVGKASIIRQKNAQLLQNLENIKSAMINLNDSWQSEAATTIIGKMEAMDPKFKEYNLVVEEYAAFLVKAAEAYEETENMTNTYASSFL